jgi:dynein heavy chain 1
MRELMKVKVSTVRAFAWLRNMRFYFNPNERDVLRRLTIQMANAQFHYGFEYLGVQEKLVQVCGTAVVR